MLSRLGLGAIHGESLGCRRWIMLSRLGFEGCRRWIMLSRLGPVAITGQSVGCRRWIMLSRLAPQGLQALAFKCCLNYKSRPKAQIGVDNSQFGWWVGCL